MQAAARTQITYLRLHVDLRARLNRYAAATEQSLNASAEQLLDRSLSEWERDQGVQVLVP